MGHDEYQDATYDARTVLLPLLFLTGCRTVDNHLYSERYRMNNSRKTTVNFRHIMEKIIVGSTSVHGTRAEGRVGMECISLRTVVLGQMYLLKVSKILCAKS